MLDHSLDMLWIIMVLLIDRATPLGVADGILYVPCIAFTMRHKNIRFTLIHSLICTIAVCSGIFISRDAGITWWVPLVNRLYSLIAIWLMFFFVMKYINDSMKISRLEKMITISAWTKQVQYKGEWIPIEHYLKQEFNIVVSHGIDPESAEKLVADIDPKFFDTGFFRVNKQSSE